MPVQYSELVARDIVAMCQPLLKGGGWYIDPKTQKITPKQVGIDFNTPWVHVLRDTCRKCEDWQIIFQLTKIRPKRCYHCWKVVIRMSTIEDLFGLRDYMAFDIKHPCKCGWDNRPYTSGVYSGYFYCDTKESGLEILKKVRADLKPVFKAEYNISLKRGCTEMEIQHKDNWENTISDQLIEGMFIQHVHIPDKNYPQPDIVKLHVMRRWIENASRMGDQTVKKYNDGEMLSPVLKNYED
ncbi:MAG: hypothetical protein KKC03_13620 [Bacteroidetes bacterium]|nr:hypothetical protein [Bacteroidota bacterium]